VDTAGEKVAKDRRPTGCIRDDDDDRDIEKCVPLIDRKPATQTYRIGGLLREMFASREGFLNECGMSKLTASWFVNTTRHTSFRARGMDWTSRQLRVHPDGNGKGNRDLE
jgi:hypothetical protein